jgi:hypothetical protein
LTAYKLFAAGAFGHFVGIPNSETVIVILKLRALIDFVGSRSTPALAALAMADRQLTIATKQL